MQKHLPFGLVFLLICSVARATSPTQTAPGAVMSDGDWHPDHFFFFMTSISCVPWMHFGAREIDKTFHIKANCYKFASDILNGDTSNQDWNSTYTQVWAENTSQGCLLEKFNNFKYTSIQLYVSCEEMAVDIIRSYPISLH